GAPRPGIEPGASASSGQSCCRERGPLGVPSVRCVWLAQFMAINPTTQYATDRNLASRQRLWSTSRRVPEVDLFSWVLDLAGATQQSTLSILDVGCGNGAYERALVKRGHGGLRVALDLSAGMLPLVNDAAPVQADVQTLPFSR